MVGRLRAGNGTLLIPKLKDFRLSEEEKAAASKKFKSLEVLDTKTQKDDRMGCSCL